MKTNLKFLIFAFIFGLALVFGVNTTYASFTVLDLQPAATISYNEPLVINSTLRVTGPAYFPAGVHIGQQGTGGVTYFNGTIVNATTTKGIDNPVTIGDKLRVDDLIYRIEQGGSNPIKFADNLNLQGYSILNAGNIYGTFIGNLQGNASTVTNGVYTSRSYSDPSWLVSLSASKLTTGTLSSSRIADGSLSIAKIANLQTALDSKLNLSGGTMTGNLTVLGVVHGTFIGNLQGNASTVTNGVYTSGSYSNPSWLVSLSASKLTSGTLDPDRIANGSLSIAKTANLQDTLDSKLNLSGGTMTGNLTVSGVIGLTDTDIPDTITASNYLPLSGGTITGNLNITDGNLNITGGLSVGDESNFNNSLLANHGLYVADWLNITGNIYNDTANNPVTINDDLSVSGSVNATQLSSSSIIAPGDLTISPNGKLIGSSEGNANQLVLATNGRVGIGTASPLSTLHIYNSVSPDIRIDSDSGSTTGFLRFSKGGIQKFAIQMAGNDYTHFFVGTSEKVTIDTSGNVGIGTTSPNSTLDVNGTLGVSSDAYINGILTAGNALTVLGNANLGDGNGGDTINVKGDLYVKNDDGSATKLTINNNTGNTIIEGDLQVNGLTTLINLNASGGTIDNTTVGTTSPAAGRFTTLQADTSLTINGTTTLGNGDDDLAVNNNQLFVESSGGYVGIGTATPIVPLDVNGHTRTNSLTIGGGQEILGHFSNMQNRDFPSIAAHSCYTTSNDDFIVGGAQIDDAVVASPVPTSGGADTLNLVWSAWVPAGGGKVRLRLCNPTDGALDPVSQGWRIDVWDHW